MKPTPAQLRAGRAAALALKSRPGVKSFTADVGPYVEAIYEAMTDDEVMPAPALVSPPDERL